VKPAFRLWPRGFSGQVMLVLLLAVLVQFVAGSVLVGADETDMQRQDLGRRIAEQLLVAERVIDATEPEDRARVLSALSTHHVQIDLVEGPAPMAPGIEAAASDIYASLLSWEPALAEHEMRLAITDPPGRHLRRRLEGALSIGEDRWITFRTLQPVEGWVVAVGTLLRVGMVALVVLATVALLMRTLSAPLRRLSDNAAQIGTSVRIDFDETRGPRELRRLSRALNEMQDRIEALIAQRTSALAAVGHDLRTPLARLRLRLSSVSNEEDRQAAGHDINEMSRMLQELMDFFGAGDAAQEPEPVDLASLCATICEEFEDLGAMVLYHGPERLVAPAFYGPLRRAITNLVDNAVKYGGRAEVNLSRRADGVIIEVMDEGPGIPPEALARVQLPFERLNVSRGAAHPGIGLGLSIAKRAAEQHGGALELRNRSRSGLAARLFVPAT